MVPPFFPPELAEELVRGLLVPMVWLCVLSAGLGVALYGIAVYALERLMDALRRRRAHRPVSSRFIRAVNRARLRAGRRPLPDGITWGELEACSGCGAPVGSAH